MNTDSCEDDNNPVDSDGCDPYCRLPMCGDGIYDHREILGWLVGETCAPAWHVREVSDYSLSSKYARGAEELRTLYRATSDADRELGYFDSNTESTWRLFFSLESAEEWIRERERQHPQVLTFAPQGRSSCDGD